QRAAAITDDPLLVAERLGEAFSQADADVFDGVMRVDMQVAVRLDFEVEQRVPGEQREHVIEESDAGADLDLLRAVQFELQPDVGLGGLAMNRGGAGHAEAVRGGEWNSRKDRSM